MLLRETSCFSTQKFEPVALSIWQNTFCPKIKLSNSWTLKLDGVEIRVFFSDLSNNRAEEKQMFRLFTFADLRLLECLQPWFE